MIYEKLVSRNMVKLSFQEEDIKNKQSKEKEFNISMAHFLKILNSRYYFGKKN